MLIQEACELLKKELLGSGYEYGFYRDGRTYKADLSKGLDEDFFRLLLTEYRVQDPEDTKAAKVGTCHDAAVLMRAMLAEHDVPSKIWLQHDREKGKFHTVLTFEAENRTVYLELTPQSSRENYGREIVFDSEQAFIDSVSQDGCEVIDVTGEVVIGGAPDFVLSRM